MSSTPSLAARHSDATHRLILDAAIELLEQSTDTELTVRAVARQAGMSERTIFRYYASRDAFLDGVAGAVHRSFETPAPPRTLRALPGYPRDLYCCFEQHSGLVRATLQSQLASRIRRGVGLDRWRAVRELIDTAAPHRAERERAIAAANMNFHLSATAWHFYRFYFLMPLEETIEAAGKAIALEVRDVTAGRSRV